MSQRISPFAIGILVVTTFAACGGQSSQPVWTALPERSPQASPSGGPAGSEAPVTSPAASAAASAPAESAPAGETVEVTVGTDTGGALQFDPASVTVPAGSSVSLVFENRSSSVPHNLTLGPPISKGTATIVDPGASETLEFTAPDPGDYKFMCTLHPGMEGTLTVE